MSKAYNDGLIAGFNYSLDRPNPENPYFGQEAKDWQSGIRQAIYDIYEDGTMKAASYG